MTLNYVITATNHQLWPFSPTMNFEKKGCGYHRKCTQYKQIYNELIGFWVQPKMHVFTNKIKEERYYIAAKTLLVSFIFAPYNEYHEKSSFL